MTTYTVEHRIDEEAAVQIEYAGVEPDCLLLAFGSFYDRSCPTANSTSRSPSQAYVYADRPQALLAELCRRARSESQSFLLA